MDPFSTAYKYNTHDSPLWPTTGRDANLTSHYRFYSDFQDTFEAQPFENNLENPSLDLYDIPHQHGFFSFMPPEQNFFHSRNFFPMPSRVPTFNGVETDYGEEVGSKREEAYANQAEAFKFQASRHSSAQAQGNDNNALKGFMDLVSKSSSFWMNKFSGPASLSSALKHHEDDSHENQKGLFGKKDVKLTISYPCLISANSLNNHRAAFESAEDTPSVQKASVRETSRAEKTLEDFKVKRVSQKKIKKIPKVTQEKWGSTHDQKLLSLVQQLGCSWNEIAESFKEDSVTAKYLRERYRVISKKGNRPKRQAFTREEDLEIAKYYKMYEGNWESISKFFPTRRSAVIRNRFYSTIRGNLEEYLKEIEGVKGDEKTSTTIENDTSSQQMSSNSNSNADHAEEKEVSCDDQEKEAEEEHEEGGMEVEDTFQKSQEDLLDSYFNKSVDESKDLFNENEKTGEDEDKEEGSDSQDSLTLTRKIEDDAIGGKAWEDKPAKEAIEILNGRISLLTSLYNQTKIELVKLQSEDKDV